MTADNKVSELWADLSDSLFGAIDESFLSNFRRPGGANKRLAAWDPFDPTMRYFKFLLFSTAARKPEKFFRYYGALKNVDIGNPTSVKVRSCDINVDYLFSVEECLFIDRCADLAKLRSVIEIGAGFGRTCHAIVSLGERLESYTIVDLPSMLNLSRAVLAKAVPEHLDKIKFVDATDVAAWQQLKADLAININSFQEMPEATIDAYMSDLVSNCAHAYIKNPVGKYTPESVGLEIKDKRTMHDVFTIGRCRDVIDIFDEDALNTARRRYVDLYKPARGWTLIADEPLEMVPYFHHAFYSSPSTGA